MQNIIRQREVARPYGGKKASPHWPDMRTCFNATYLRLGLSADFGHLPLLAAWTGAIYVRAARWRGEVTCMALIAVANIS